MTDTTERTVHAALADENHNRTLEIAFDVTSDGLAVTDASGNFKKMNHSHLKMFGYYDFSEILDNSWKILYTSDVIEHIISIVFPVLAERGTWRGELIGISKSGSWVPQDVTLTSLQNGGLLCATRDLTHIRQNEAERASLAAIISELEYNQTARRVAEQFQHDICNLLAAIRFSAAALAVHPNFTTPIDKALDQAHVLLNKMAKLPAQFQPSMESHGLSEIAQNCVELCSAIVPQRVRLHVQGTDPDINVWADRSLLERTLVNLIKNAIEAVSLAGQVHIHVSCQEPPPKFDAPSTLRLGRKVEAPSVWLLICDDGEGMSEAQLLSLEAHHLSTKVAEQGMLRGLGFSSLLTLVLACDVYAEVQTVKDAGTCIRLQMRRFT